MQDSPDSFDHLILIYFLLQVKTIFGTRPLSIAAQTLWNSFPVSMKYVRTIITFRRKPNIYLFKLILHSSAAYQPNLLQLELLIHYELLNLCCFGGNISILLLYKFMFGQSNHKKERGFIYVNNLSILLHIISVFSLERTTATPGINYVANCQQTTKYQLQESCIPFGDTGQNCVIQNTHRKHKRLNKY